MKAVIKVEVEFDDESVNEWGQRFQEYHTNLYGSEELGRKALEENPFENAIAQDIEDMVYNYEEGIISCNAYVEYSDRLGITKEDLNKVMLETLDKFKKK